MSDSDKPNPIEDIRKGLGLLFRAAKTTLEQLPTGKLEEAVVTGAKEVGRAIENVTQQVEKQIFGNPKGEAPAPPENAQASGAPATPPKGDADATPDANAPPPEPKP